MKKVFRLFIISALLLGIFIPVFDHYYHQEEVAGVTMAQQSKDRNISELLKLAKESFYDGNYQSAENYYQQIIELSPFNLESRRNLAVIYNEQNELRAENQILLQTAILSNNNQDYLNLAVNFYELNNNLASNYILENKIDKENNGENFLYQKYYYLIKNNLDLNNYEKAEEYLMKITNLKLNQSEVYLLSAELNKKRGDFEQAFNNYEAAYQANRSQSYLFKDMAEMLEKSGEEIKAYNHWQRTLAYGWFRDLAYQKINFYQDKYPRLRPEPEEEDEPEEINPFDLEPSWHEVEELSSQEKIQMLRIGLQENNEHLLFQYSAPFSVVYDGKIIYRGQAQENHLLQVESGSLFISTEAEKLRLGNSDLEYQIYSSQKNSSFYVYNINYGQGYFWQGSGNRQYRGNMIIKGEGDDFTLINQVELTPYLISVVPSEIYASWPMESLKAQAIAARSYTLSNLGRHSSDGYDLCSTVHCAAYNGIQSEHPRTTEAVLSTQGESAVFEGRIIEAVFSSNSGGFTERSDQIWSADLPYLRGANQMKNDEYNFPLTPVELQQWLIASPESYSKDFGSSNYRWQLRVPAEVIEYRSELNRISKIEVNQRAQGGTITSLTIYSDQEQKNYSVSQIRRVLGGLKSSRFYFDSHYDRNGYLKEIYIYGSGWGHNLGLDQSASAGMGADGWDYREIIKHFYPGVEIKKLN
ncbi:SpoIID/LytB domain protein [Halanaerobium saccharolyticum]|uniref:SpoIID/LytB domain protein n=1 Tax=Halanaerobium saccharolyticum TaxID=43595 RepID=A0A4R7YWJ6_9FIRM|nr:SpoIID/LytB domain-containing protein [Halanaerobium saccharolyticum]RAK06177.1 SpoIID/LytB domain protein [Halanaerobium saccharolyticum]TDW00542.1 SpoIID/LytB domain protein [Halanaerobium saccharolyticum]TDX52207.1 SpoIID/LytB domain protein [Halanaerobium saccharolyticum]